MNRPGLGRLAVTIAALLGVLAVVALTPLSPVHAMVTRAAPGASTAAGTAADGASVVSEDQVDARTLDITISSLAVAGDVQVRLLLPPGWTSSATQTWPVLYLLHGCCDAYDGWTENTNIVTETQGAPVIIALPDGGPAGMYSNWWNFGSGGENYETFVATELPQILRSGFHAGAKQAIGGVSTGGGAALFIAAHNPGTYAAEAAYSGTDCTEQPSEVTVLMALLVRAGIDPLNLWGSNILQLSLWQQHDPCYLAPELKGSQIFLSVGSGLTLSGGQTSCTGGGNILESTIAPGAYQLAADLTTQGIGYTADFYSGGCHSWPYWQTAFDQSWPMLESALGA